MLQDLLSTAFLPACAGYALSSTIHHFQAKRSADAARRLIYSCGLIAASVNSAPDDPRVGNIIPLLMLTTVAAAGVSWRLFSRFTSRIWKRIVGVLAVIASIDASLSVPFRAFQMHPTTYSVVRSPGGRYEAHLIYYDGLTFGYYFVSVQDVSPLMRWLPVHEVAEAAAEGFDSIHWKDSRTLVISYDSDASFVQKDRRWNDVSIQYVQTPQTQVPPFKARAPQSLFPFSQMPNRVKAPPPPPASGLVVPPAGAHTTQ